MENRIFYLDTINKTANFSFSYNYEIKELLKNSDNDARWSDLFKQWIVPINEYSINIIKRVIREFEFTQIPEPIQENVEYSYKKNKIDYAYLKGLCDAKDFEYLPRKYQLEALAYALDKGSFINGDAVGVGKTFESIMYTEVTNKFPCLVVVPSSVKYNWKEKWLEITKNRCDISVIESNKKNDWTKNIIVINYDIIGKKHSKGVNLRFKELGEIDWKMIIFDEAHFLKNNKSQRSKAAKIICKNKCPKQLLTGTPTLSKPIEVWNLLTLINIEAKVAGNWMNFIKRYCGAYKGSYGWVTDGATNTLELNKKLREFGYIRRESSEVLDELPKYIEEIIEIPITNKNKINVATNDFISYIRKTKGEDKANKAMEAEHLVAINELKKLSIEGKLKGIIQYLKDWKETSDEKLVVFGISKDILIKLSEMFDGMLINGGTNSKRKQEIVNEWKVNDKQFLFGNIEACGTGTDGMQKVSHNMLIIELPWRPSDITQVIGRLYRSGQLNKVIVRFLLSKLTIDSQIKSMLEDKEKVVDAVNKGVDARNGKSSLKRVINKILKLKS